MVRLFKPSDYEMLKNWWIRTEELPPQFDMLPLETTFIYEKDGTPIYSVSLYLTNCKGLALIENFVKNPDYKSKEGAQEILNFAYKYAKDRGYKRVIGFTNKEKLVKRYAELGLTQFSQYLYSLVREL